MRHSCIFFGERRSLAIKEGAFFLRIQVGPNSNNRDDVISGVKYFSQSISEAAMKSDMKVNSLLRWAVAS